MKREVTRSEFRGLSTSTPREPDHPIFEHETHSAPRPHPNRITCKARSPAVLLNVDDVIWKITRNPVTLASDCTTVACKCG